MLELIAEPIIDRFFGFLLEKGKARFTKSRDPTLAFTSGIPLDRVISLTTSILLEFEHAKGLVLYYADMLTDFYARPRKRILRTIRNDFATKITQSLTRLGEYYTTLENDFPFCVGLLSLQISYPRITQIIAESKEHAIATLKKDPDTAVEMIRQRLRLNDRSIKLLSSPRRVFEDLSYANPGYWLTMVLPLCLLEPILLIERLADRGGVGSREYVRNLDHGVDPISATRTRLRSSHMKLLDTIFTLRKLEMVIDVFIDGFERTIKSLASSDFAHLSVQAGLIAAHLRAHSRSLHPYKNLNEKDRTLLKKARTMLRTADRMVRSSKKEPDLKKAMRLYNDAYNGFCRIHSSSVESFDPPRFFADGYCAIDKVRISHAKFSK